MKKENGSLQRLCYLLSDCRLFINRSGKEAAESYATKNICDAMYSLSSGSVTPTLSTLGNFYVFLSFSNPLYSKF